MSQMGSSRTSCLLGETFARGLFSCRRSRSAQGRVRVVADSRARCEGDSGAPAARSVAGVRWRCHRKVGFRSERHDANVATPWQSAATEGRCGSEAVVSDKTSRIGRLGWIQIDTSDPERLAAFWKLILGVEIEGRLGSPPQFVNLHKQYPDAPHVSFQRVPEPKVVKNRVHMDIVVDDVEIATSRIVQLGGRRRRPDADFNEYGYCWRTMADPDGNEFCLIFKCG